MSTKKVNTSIIMNYKSLSPETVEKLARKSSPIHRNTAQIVYRNTNISSPIVKDSKDMKKTFRFQQTKSPPTVVTRVNTHSNIQTSSNRNLNYQSSRHTQQKYSSTINKNT